MVTAGIIIINSTLIKTIAQLDMSTTRYALIDKNYICNHNFLLQPLQKYLLGEIIDSQLIAAGEMTHIT